MSIRICIVTPFAWSQNHEANEHVRAVAKSVEELGHTLAILAPSNRASELTAGRRALRLLEQDQQPLQGFVAVGPAVSVSRRERAGVPVGVRANLRLALGPGSFDIVHVYDPARMSLSNHALQITDALTIATFHSPDGVGQHAGKKRRERLLTRVDALTATSQRALEAARERFSGDYHLLPLGIDIDQIRASSSTDRPVLLVEWHPDEKDTVKAILRTMQAIPEWDICVLRTKQFAGRPYIPRALRERCTLATARDEERRTSLISQCTAYVSATQGSERARAEAQALGVPLIEASSGESLASTLARYQESASSAAAAASERSGSAENSDSPIDDHSTSALAKHLDSLYGELLKRRRPAARERSKPLADRPWILCDLHNHTEFSHDCSVPVVDLLDEAERLGLGAIAVTDHNVFAGAQLAHELSKERELTVIPGEEMKTERGEVIGLFIQEEIPAGLSMEDTIVAIRDQGGLVYLPHPFDRMHSIARPETIHRLLGEIDAIEVYNARLLFDAYNDEALRFARKYNMLMGAGSDAHVLQGLGTGLARMRAFTDGEEFLVSLRTAEIVRRPKSLLYLQGLKWVAQARERRARAGVR